MIQNNCTTKQKKSQPTYFSLKIVYTLLLRKVTKQKQTSTKIGSLLYIICYICLYNDILKNFYIAITLKCACQTFGVYRKIIKIRC